MLGLFRNNQFTTAFFLALYVGLTHLASLLGFVEPQETIVAKSGVLYQSWFGWASAHPFFCGWRGDTGFIQSLFVNNLADEFRILNGTELVAGFVLCPRYRLPARFFVLSPPWLRQRLFGWIEKNI
ncbi:MAG: hypothetical protein IPJ82_14405 [Lewinellaceae bacterium]|nr:hypothetical protein [Lewinellaceae bacterium]